MGMLGVVVIAVVTAVLGGIALLSLAAAYDFATRTYTGVVAVTPAAAVDEGLVKVHGTVVADRTLDPAVAESPTVMSMLTRYEQGGLSGRTSNSWDVDAELLRAVDFEVEDDSGSVPVEHVDDPHQSGFAGLEHEATVELRGGDAVPAPIDDAFSEPTPDIEAVGDALEADGDEEAAALARELRAPRDGDAGVNPEQSEPRTDGGSDSFETTDEYPDDATGASDDSNSNADDATAVLAETSPLRTGDPQKFEETFTAPGDEVYVIGRAADGTITNESGTFRVLHQPRSKFDLLKGAAGAATLLGFGIAAGYGTVNWLLLLGRELFDVMAFIA